PASYRNKIFIAQHGSWNRSRPDGYRVVVVTLENNKAVKYDHFATGWLLGEEYWGRPVDIEVLHDGSLLVSDDFANCIYRVTYDE
ncbi:sorbosone dehydrogenase family protein, partial [candidate division KSB1 bacterium]|nr:sorbosone dehydrogenase family protein [candidate division KSB1 bacterium]